MRIAKPLLLTITPIGVVLGFYEARNVAPGLVILMAIMLSILIAALIHVVRTIRRERDAAQSSHKTD